MAKQILLYVFASFICMNTFANNSGEKDSEKEVSLAHEITDLSTPDKILRSSLDVVQVTVSNHYLNLYVLVPVGDIYFEVTNASGELIYQNTINSSNQEELIIEISNWDKGNYKVIVAYENGMKRLRGNFEIE